MDSAKAPAPKVFYFGFYDGGHRLIDKNGDSFYGNDVSTPWGSHPDATLLEAPLVLRKVDENEGMQPEGKAILHHKDGWTALGFWDRSGDSRYNSNSNFLVRGTYTFDEMLALAKEQFHGIFARMKFPITEIKNEKATEEAEGAAG
jgi:hypothetical protein